MKVILKEEYEKDLPNFKGKELIVTGRESNHAEAKNERIRVKDQDSGRESWSSLKYFNIVE